MLSFFIRLLMRLLRRPLGLDRLSFIELLPLRSDLAAARNLYGAPLDTRAHDGIQDAQVHMFATLFVGIRVVELKGLVQSITYASDRPSRPAEDLKHMLETYGENVGWSELSPGYSYMRKDRDRRLFCSAIPMINVATEEFIGLEVEALKQQPSA